MAATLGLTACSGESETVTPPTVQLTTTTTAPTTTSTTEPTTTTTQDPDIAEILAVYNGALRYFKPNQALDPEVPGLENFITDPLYSTKQRILSEWAADGFVLGEGEYKVHVLDVTVDGDTATVRSCNLDGAELLDSDGLVFIPSDTERYLRLHHLIRTPEGWRVTASEFVNGERTTCDA